MSEAGDAQLHLPAGIQHGRAGHRSFRPRRRHGRRAERSAPVEGFGQRGNAAGQGTTFRLKLPLTLAIIKALLFWVEERLYAIPLNAVLEIARTFEAEVHQVDNYEVLQLRNQVLPLLRLGRPAPEGDRKAKLFVLVITVGERKYGLIVDALEGEEELVIKALDDQTFSTDLVSGASILGDGRVVLILNLPAVVEHVVRGAAAGNGTGQFRPVADADRSLAAGTELRPWEARHEEDGARAGGRRFGADAEADPADAGRR